MRVGHLDIKAPLILGGQESEAEVLGATVWLWMHSPMHRDAPLHACPPCCCRSSNASSTCW